MHVAIPAQLHRPSKNAILTLLFAEKSLISYVFQLIFFLVISVADPNPDPDPPDPRVFGPPGSGSGPLVKGMVPDPDPPDPRVFGPSGSTSQRYGSGSGSFYHHAKIVRKTLIPPLFEFLSFKNDVNVAS